MTSHKPLPADGYPSIRRTLSWATLLTAAGALAVVALALMAIMVMLNGG